MIITKQLYLAIKIVEGLQFGRYRSLDFMQQHTTAKFARKLAFQLCKEKILKSKRGQKGGYKALVKEVSLERLSRIFNLSKVVYDYWPLTESCYKIKIKPKSYL